MDFIDDIFVSKEQNQLVHLVIDILSVKINLSLWISVGKKLKKQLSYSDSKGYTDRLGYIIVTNWSALYWWTYPLEESIYTDEMDYSNEIRTRQKSRDILTM